MSVASQSLMDNITYEDLYKRWEHGNWSAYDIDFSQDRTGWEALTDIQRRSAMWIYSMFYYGEDRVADTLAPYITAAPTEEMPPGVFPFDPDASEDQIAANQVKMMLGGILGPPDGPPPASTPELQRLYFDVITRAVDPKAADGSPLVYQWRFRDADPWHVIIDNGSTRAEPGEAANPNLVIESTWSDWIASGKPDANQLKMVLQRRIKPKGSVREVLRMRKVFPS